MASERNPRQRSRLRVPACMAAAGPPNAFQHAPSPLVEASIKMAEQLGRTAGQIAAGRTDLVGRGLRRGAGPILKLTVITHQRFSSPFWSGDEVRKASRDRRSSWPWRPGHGARASETPIDRSFAENVGVGAPAARSSRSTAEAQLAGQAVTERRSQMSYLPDALRRASGCTVQAAAIWHRHRSDNRPTVTVSYDH